MMATQSQPSSSDNHPSSDPTQIAPALTLFLIPKTSSFAVHIALREIGVPFETRVLSGPQSDTRKPEFLKINAAGQVPTLLIDGRPLSEVAGILFYLARRFPEADLLPQDDPESEARVVAWHSFLASSAHAAWRAGGDEAIAIYKVAESRLASSGWAVGDRFSIADIHLFRLFWRFHGSAGLSRDAFPGLFAHHDRVLVRASVRQALEAEASLT
jgi:glutathione S-transferase